MIYQPHTLKHFNQRTKSHLSPRLLRHPATPAHRPGAFPPWDLKHSVPGRCWWLALPILSPGDISHVSETAILWLLELNRFFCVSLWPRNSMLLAAYPEIKTVVSSKCFFEGLIMQHSNTTFKLGAHECLEHSVTGNMRYAYFL